MSDEATDGKEANVMMHGINHFAAGASKGIVQLVRPPFRSYLTQSV